jgi:hypothetical protein
MVRIAITQEAPDAIASTMPLGNAGFENAATEKGERLIWLEPAAARLTSTTSSGDPVRASPMLFLRLADSVEPR